MGCGLQNETNDAKSSTTQSREAFFLDFATGTTKRFPNMILMITGGFRTRRGSEAALKSGVCDLVGIGRPAVLNADFPRLIMDEDFYSDINKPGLRRTVKGAGAGGQTILLFLNAAHRHTECSPYLDDPKFLSKISCSPR